MNQQASALVTAADISRLAGVTRATVSNWRRRHPDFPAPAGGTDTSPTYDVDAVRAWLSARGQLPDDTPADELRTALRTHPGDGELALHLLPALLAAARLDRRKREALPELRDDALLRWARSATADEADHVPGIEGPAYGADTAGPLRALVRCVVMDGAEAATDVLAERLLEDTGSTGTYRTPRLLADLMARLLTDSAGDFPTSVLDPACGTGSLLAAAASAGATELRGQDILIAQAAQAAVRLRLSTPEAVISVRAGDSLRSDAFKGLTTVAVLCNPPYGVRDWGHEDLAYDQRWAYGVPPKGEPELAWVQHSLSHLAPGGRAVLLMPPAVAERTAGRRIRAQLVRDGALRAVVSLPQGAATPLHIGLHLWVLERPDPQAEPPGTVLLVDAAAAFGNRNLDWAAIDSTVLSAWRHYRADRDGFTGTPGIAGAVPITDLLTEAVDLTPARSIRTASEQALRPALLARQASELYGQLHRAAQDLTGLSTEGDWPPADDRPRDWRTATVADLLRGGALSLLRTAPAGRRTRSGEPLPRPEPELGGRPTLTATDVVQNRPASGTTADLPTDAPLPLIQGSDVLLTETLRVGHRVVARVVEPDETGCFLGPHLLLFRPDQRRLDAWFLAGFLAAEQNVNAAATGTSIVRVDPRRLRVPLLPLAEQQRYGAAFRHLHELRTAARRTDQAAENVTRLLSTGLTGGALLPDGHGSA